MSRPITFPHDYLEDLLILRQRGLTVRQAAAELGMSKDTAYRLLRRQEASQ